MRRAIFKLCAFIKYQISRNITFKSSIQYLLGTLAVLLRTFQLLNMCLCSFIIENLQLILILYLLLILV
jgi:hypothetical protein